MKETEATKKRCEMVKLNLVETNTQFYPDKSAIYCIQRLVDDKGREYYHEEWQPMNEDDAKKLAIELPQVILDKNFHRNVKKVL